MRAGQLNLPVGDGPLLVRLSSVSAGFLFSGSEMNQGVGEVRVEHRLKRINGRCALCARDTGAGPEAALSRGLPPVPLSGTGNRDDR